MATRKDVARSAGVSVRTVSNVVNGFEHVSPATRARVLTAIEGLSYYPSELARSLKVGRSGLVGLMLPELDTPYFAELTRACVEEGTARGMTVVIDQTDGDRERELAWIRRATKGSLFDALILSPLALQPADFGLIPRETAVVLVGEHACPGFDRVMVDSIAASREVVAHLAGLGRRRIAAVGMESSGRATSAQRLAGYTAGLAAMGLPFDERYVAQTSNFGRAEGYRGMSELLRLFPPPDAVFCFSDPLALGALRAAHDLGVRVPADVAVVGFDDVQDGWYSVPTLTSISPDKRSLARTVFDRLVRQLQDLTIEPETFLTPYRLVLRESTAGCSTTY